MCEDCPEKFSLRDKYTDWENQQIDIINFKKYKTEEEKIDVYRNCNSNIYENIMTPMDEDGLLLTYLPRELAKRHMRHMGIQEEEWWGYVSREAVLKEYKRPSELRMKFNIEKSMVRKKMDHDFGFIKWAFSQPGNQKNFLFDIISKENCVFCSVFLQTYYKYLSGESILSLHRLIASSRSKDSQFVKEFCDLYWPELNQKQKKEIVLCIANSQEEPKEKEENPTIGFFREFLRSRYLQSTIFNQMTPKEREENRQAFFSVVVVEEFSPEDMIFQTKFVSKEGKESKGFFCMDCINYLTVDRGNKFFSIEQCMNEECMECGKKYLRL